MERESDNKEVRGPLEVVKDTIDSYYFSARDFAGGLATSIHCFHLYPIYSDRIKDRLPKNRAFRTGVNLGVAGQAFFYLAQLPLDNSRVFALPFVTNAVACVANLGIEVAKIVRSERGIDTDKVKNEKDLD